jgi:DNA-binding transcriptional regulator LsrR (DeoR family)
MPMRLLLLPRQARWLTAIPTFVTRRGISCSVPSRSALPGSLHHEGFYQSLLGTRPSATVAERLQGRLHRLGDLRRQPARTEAAIMIRERGTDTLVRCAWLYHTRDHTQHEVATELGLSRATVARMLKEAKERGLVRVTVESPVRLLELADRLRERWAPHGVREVRLVQSVSDIEEQKAVLAAELPFVLPPVAGKVVGVSWGTTLGAGVEQVPMPGSTNGNGAGGTRVVSMLGGVTGSMRAADPYGVAVQLGQRLRASVYALTAPLYVRDRNVANLLAGHESVRGPLELAADADVALFGVGDLESQSTIVRLGVITHEERRWLREQGAVGDVIGHFLDVQGRPVTAAADLLAPICLGLDQLRAIPERICLAGGPDKHDMLLATVRAGLVTRLLTDERTAERLLTDDVPDAG